MLLWEHVAIADEGNSRSYIRTLYIFRVGWTVNAAIVIVYLRVRSPHSGIVHGLNPLTPSSGWLGVSGQYLEMALLVLEH